MQAGSEEATLAAEEAARKAALATQGAVTDSDISDEAAGRARLELAAASEARRQEEAKQLSKENAAHHAMLASTGTKTDVDIMDEEAGRMRLELAAQSKARKEEEAKQLASENAATRAALARQGTRTDFDISDEAAGKARLEMAAASKARMAQETMQLVQDNAAMHRKLQNTQAATDMDISDEAAGKARGEFRRASMDRREKEQLELSKANAELKERLRRVQARTDDGDGAEGGLDASFFSRHRLDLGQLERPSATTTQTYVRFKNAEAKHHVADKTRAWHVQNEEQRSANTQQWKSVGQRRLNSARKRQDRIRTLHAELQRQKQMGVHTLRADEASRSVVREERQKALAQDTLLKVMQEKLQMKQMAATEGAMQEDQRQAGVALKLELQSAVENVRTTQLKHHKTLAAETVRNRNAIRSAVAENKEVAKQNVVELKLKSRDLAKVRQQRDAEYVQSARLNRERAIEFRQSARQSKEDLLKERRAGAKKERDNDALAIEAKEKILRDNRREVASVFKTRFVGKSEEQEWKSSSYRRLTVMTHLARRTAGGKPRSARGGGAGVGAVGRSPFGGLTDDGSGGGGAPSRSPVPPPAVQQQLGAAGAASVEQAPVALKSPPTEEALPVDVDAAEM